MAHEPRILVVEGNTKAACSAMEQAGGVPNGALYARTLKELFPTIKTDLVYPAEANETLPSGAALADYDGVAVGGSALRAADVDDPVVSRQVELARAVFESGTPFFGSCWAAQIAAVAAGGVVQASPFGREVGVARKIAITPEGAGHPLFVGKPHVFDALCIHFDEITHLPPGAVVLATNDHSRVQAVSMTYRGGTFHGVQYHPEYDLPQMATLIDRYWDAMADQGFYVDQAAAQRHADLLRALHQNPSRTDIAWLLGMDEDILDRNVHTREIRNWVERIVVPAMSGRR